MTFPAFYVTIYSTKNQEGESRLTAGKYKALRALNTSGTVTLAENSADGRKYVLKELPGESAAMYRRISELPPQENLMRVCEILLHGERSVAVCEYVEGQPLDELLSSGKTFPIIALRRIISQLCNTVEHLHRYGIIHRDVTPKNIILDENLHLTLIDFDISRKFSGNLEQDTTLYGTEGFAPPEQYGFRETGFTADIYALGVIMKLLLNACPDCPPTQEVRLRKIAAKCTRFVPDKRYRSAGAVRHAVSRSRFAVPAGISAASLAVLVGVLAAVLLRNYGENMPPEIPQVSVSSPAETTAVTTAQTTSATAVGTSITTEKSVPETQVSTAQTTTATTTAQTSKQAVTTAQTATTTTSKPAKTTARTTAATAHTTASAEIPQELLPHELHRSDEDNPDKITVTTKLNEQGLYEDYFDYAFYDDPAVHGEWDYCTYIPLESLNSTLTAEYIRNRRSDEIFIFSALNIGDNGECECFLSDGSKTPCESRWTNGYLICDYAEGTAAQSLFEITIDGEEFLFAALKTGDFSRENKVYNYAVYTRAE